MITLLICLAILLIVFCIVYFAAVIIYRIAMFFISGMAYCYWGLSIGMAPILWILMIVGIITGFSSALKNAIIASKALKGKGVD